MTARQQEGADSAEQAKRGAEARNWSRIKGPGRVEASVWTECMVSALANGVKGG